MKCAQTLNDAGFTWRPQQTPTADAIKVMKTAVTRGANFWNGGTFYGPPTYNSLQLLNSYFTEYPEDADKVVISIKGPVKGDAASVRRSVDDCLSVLDGKKHLDIYECARVDPKTPIEETITALAQYVKEGKLGGICMDGTNAEPIRRAAAVHKIACVELEFSLFAREMMSNGVAKTCEELGIPIVAYSPLGRGFLVSIRPSCMASWPWLIDATDWPTRACGRIGRWRRAKELSEDPAW